MDYSERNWTIICIKVYDLGESGLSFVSIWIPYYGPREVKMDGHLTKSRPSVFQTIQFPHDRPFSIVRSVHLNPNDHLLWLMTVHFRFWSRDWIWLTITTPGVIDRFCLDFIDDNAEFWFSKFNIYLSIGRIQIFYFDCWT